MSTSKLPLNELLKYGDTELLKELTKITNFTISEDWKNKYHSSYAQEGRQKETK